ncbi:(deoxy)nucleoside triphosphate pyrophosphohydrolase [Sphingomonas sp.]|jgi:8-oxo-dGTP diphosphatase|uniref:(deoxy)nucleoside triphosphate pyrophosphohydrolase n=1 Tax=Sphingomonas sp. TaxID=28214 RepID=UPI002DF29C9F|nr:(deoxy)nucleoside triphosphate pyrophosphohydrolase [Sphingomonas sp.]
MPDVMTVVAAALIRADGRVLLQQRGPDRSMAGLWEFPGGKVEPGETPEAALARELDEELGIAVDPALFAPAAFASAPLGSRHLLLLLYSAYAWAGEPQALDASALRWVTVDEMRSLPMPPADVPLVDALSVLLGSPERVGERG